MTKPVRRRRRPNGAAARIQARRCAAAVALLVAAACAQESPVSDDARTGCATIDFVFNKPTFSLDIKNHIDLRSTPTQVLLRRQARPLSEPIQHPAARATTGGASPPEAGAPAVEPAEPRRGEGAAGWPWFFTLMNRLDCAWPVDFDPGEIAALQVRLHVRVRQDGQVESAELISERGDPAHLLPAFRATALAAIRRAFPLSGPSGSLDRIVDDGLDVAFELRGFERNLRAAAHSDAPNR